jgi:hypothetical protein
MFEDLDFAQSANVMTRQIQRRRINVDDFPPTEKWPNLMPDYTDKIIL